ncbi:microtubule-associated protein 70-2-like [Tripterygium wilfordii]|uniref:Microtubule-associated protein 70-2-like n=1 Tax=Tripterygium wilfordii TaxID=458696 RepID=A0A7J7DP03_TRIWF|nr:microtubule-associated protein 70-2-like [Tripterygium wilfordii]
MANGNYHATSNGAEAELPRPALSSSASFKARKPKPSVYSAISRAGSDVDDIITLLHGSDPVRVELSRLENEVRDKDRELGEALAEIKSLRNSERLKEKAVEELTDELKKVDVKLKATEALLESKNLEVKKINDEKKGALSAQFAAEATLRRVHAAQKDDEMPPIEAIITPLEAELKLSRMEAAKLQEDKRALDRLTKSKEAALLEAERTVEIAVAKASLVDDLQNKNQELIKQIEICQGEMQQLRDKLAVAERTAKAEAQMKEKYLLRFKVLEEKLKASTSNSRAASDGRSINNGRSRRQSLGGAENYSHSSSNGYLSKNLFNSQSRLLRSNSASTLLRNAKMSSGSFDGGSRSLDKDMPRQVETGNGNAHVSANEVQITETAATDNESANGTASAKSKTEQEDHVSGVLYDMLQKEVIILRNSCHEKDQSLKDKDDAIEMLAKKVETLNKAMEVEAKKMRREVASMEKEVAAMRESKEHDKRTRRTSAPRGSQLLSASPLKQPHPCR